MPSDPEAIKIYHEKDIEFGPAKVLLAGLLAGFNIKCSTTRPPGSCSNYRQSVMLSMLAEAAELTDCQRCRLIVGHITWRMLGVAAVSHACLLTFAGSECGRRGRQRAGDVPEQREAAVAQGGGGRQAAHHHGASASCFLLAVSWHGLLGCGDGQMGSRLHNAPAYPSQV